MRKGDLREGRANFPVRHHSARGRPPRNSGNFTRGGQLIGHEWSMFFAAAKVPLLIWLGVFIIVYWVMLSAVMGAHEIQLCSWRLGAALWTWMDFSPYKPMNIVLANDSLRRVPIGYIPYVADVQIAWAKATHALVGSVFAGSLISFPIATWFVRYARTHGKEILEERHERGAVLVDRDILVADIIAHNTEEFEKSAAKLLPDLTPKQVLAMPFAARKKAGLHHPYSLGGVPYPYGLEQSHTIVIGTTGSGKTTQLLSLVAEMRKRGDSAVVFDLTGAFIEAFYDDTTDVILNPGDARCPCWSLFEDCTSEAEFTAASHALVPHDGGGGDPFWVVAARMLFVQMCLKLKEHGLTTNKALADNLIKTDIKRVNRILRDTAAEPLTSPLAAKMAESIRSVYAANAQALNSLPDDGEYFSIREWVTNQEKPGSILFVSARYVDLPLYKTLLTLFLDIAVNTLMTLPRTSALRTWYMFDELGALHRLPAIENGLQTARGFGGAMVLGLHSFARLQAVYGREGAENIASLAGTKLILKTADRKTAEACTEFIGHREVRQMDEGYSYGRNSLRDAATITPKKETVPLVMPDDITNLRSLQGYVKFPDGFPAARIKLHWRDYRMVAPGFIPRAPPPAAPVPKLRPKGGDASDGRDGEDPKPAPEKRFAIERTPRESEAMRQTRRELAAKAVWKLANDGNLTPIDEARSTKAIEQADGGLDASTAALNNSAPPTDDPAKAPTGLSRPGMIGRPKLGNLEARQAAMQRDLQTDFGDESAADKAIDMDDD